jgi:hypothetical protein
MLTLAEYKKTQVDALDTLTIDEFQKSSWLLQNLLFDDAAAPDGNGKTLTYRYWRVTTQPTAATRAVNAEYAAQEAKEDPYTATLAIFGGSFQLDRAMVAFDKNNNRVAFQMQQKIKAATALFNDLVFNGDTGTDANAFDGLDKAVTGSSTEYNAAGTAIDLSTSANIDTNWKAFLDALDETIALMNGQPSALFGNKKLMTKVHQVARRAGYATTLEDALGRPIDGINGVPLVDLEEKPGSTNPIIPISGGGTPGLTSLYAVRIGQDGFHGVAPMGGQNLISTYLPDLTLPGVVKTGEVEMLAAVALKATKAAAVLRKIKVS